MEITSTIKPNKEKSEDGRLSGIPLGHRPRRKSKLLGKWYVPYAFIFPNMLLFFVFMIIPIVYTMVISFTKWDIVGEPSWIGFANYIYLFKNELFYRSIYNTLLYTIATVPGIMILSLFFAIILNGRLPFRGFFRSAIYLPVVISNVVIGMVWLWIFNAEYGFLNYLLSLAGLKPAEWLSDSKLAMIPIIVTTLWARTGYNMVIYLAGLQGISESYYEAALIDGCSKWQLFVHLTFPLLRSSHVVVMITAIIYSFKSFDLIYVMTRGGPNGATTTLVQYIYKIAFDVGQMGRSSALGVILFVLIAIITVSQLRLGEQK